MRSVAVLASVFLAVAAALASGCSVGSVAGDTGHCDRRSAGVDLKPLCQEIDDTVALKEFRADCETHLRAGYGDGSCPHEKAIGGCEIGGANQDGSHVIDWYYDVAGDPKAAQYPTTDIARSLDDVRRFCSDTKRYDKGARLVAP